MECHRLQVQVPIAFYKTGFCMCEVRLEIAKELMMVSLDLTKSN